jgi:hypothetical protein
MHLILPSFHSMGNKACSDITYSLYLYHGFLQSRRPFRILKNLFRYSVISHSVQMVCSDSYSSVLFCADGIISYIFIASITIFIPNIINSSAAVNES